MKINAKILGIVIVVVVLIVAGVVLMGGGKKGVEQGPSVATPMSGQPTGQPATEQPVTEQPATETLGEILSRGAGVSSVKYDLVVTAQGAPSMTSKVWLKKNKMRTEITAGGQTAVSLIDMDAKTIYTYMPAQNIAMKSGFGAETPKSPTESIEQYQPVVTGTETIDGKVCSVVEYTAGGETTKSWLWKEKGFPIRMEITTPEGKTIMEYKNIEFVDIPDSMFELPAGVQITQMP